MAEAADSLATGPCCLPIERRGAATSALVLRCLRVARVPPPRTLGFAIPFVASEREVGGAALGMKGIAFVLFCVDDFPRGRSERLLIAVGPERDRTLNLGDSGA